VDKLILKIYIYCFTGFLLTHHVSFVTSQYEINILVIPNHNIRYAYLTLHLLYEYLFLSIEARKRIIPYVK